MNVNVHGRTRRACTHRVTAPVNTSRDGRQGNWETGKKKKMKCKKNATDLFLHIAQQFLARLGLCQENNMTNIKAHITSQHRQGGGSGGGGGGGVEKYRDMY